MQLLRRAPYVCQRCRESVAFRQHASRTRYSTASNHARSLKVAIIGSGPAGFYAAYRLMKKLPDACVDIYEHLPVPGGLVRFGVAPDHPEVKNAAETLDLVSRSSKFNFCGNIAIGSEEKKLPLEVLAQHYNALLFAYGASKDRKLGIPGEDLNGIISARAFVGWYNGLPEYEDLNPDLQSGETAVLIGQGNVALDVTRMLLAPLDELKKTDISGQALDAISKSKVTDVKVIGRRGPLQAPYTIKELRELMQMSGVGFSPPPEGWDALIGVEQKRLPRQLRRIAELLERGSKSSADQSRKAWTLGYLRSPAAFLSQDESNLQAIGFEQMSYSQAIADVITGDAQADLNALRAVRVRPTGQKSLIHTTLAFRSVGYLSQPLEGMKNIGVPFDEQKGIIPNDRRGRVISPSEGPAGALTAGHVPGMYCAGWVKRGPTGVIASTMDDAFMTADVLAKDWEQNAIFNKSDDGGWEAVRAEIQQRGIRAVDWQDWEKIDAEERRRGKEKGKEREKIRSVEEMLKVLDG